MPFVNKEYKITDLGDKVKAAFKKKLDEELNNIAREDLSFENEVLSVEYLISGDFSAEVRVYLMNYHPIEVTSTRKNRTVGEAATTIAWHLVKGLPLRNAWKAKKTEKQDLLRKYTAVQSRTTPKSATTFPERDEDVLWVGDKEDAPSAQPLVENLDS